MSYYFVTFSVVLLSIFLYIGYVSSKNISANDNYFLADRSLGIIAVSMSLLATQLGVGVILGTADFSYRYGIYGIFYSLGLFLGLSVIAILGAKQLREKNISTISELFEKEYQSRVLRKVTSIISIISLYGILISLIVGTRKLLNSFGINNEFIIYFFWSTLIVYTVLGGLKAVIYTDIVQIIFIFLTFILILTYYIFFKLEYIQFAFDNMFISIDDKEKSLLAPCIIGPFLYVFIEQDMAQRFFSAKNAKVAYISAFVAGLLLLAFSFLPLIFGIAARNISYIPQGASEMIYFFINTSNSFIISVASIAILCAIISTGDSLLCAISSNLTLDFKKNTTPINLFITRIVTILFGFVGIIIANYLDNIIETMLVSYQVMICTLFFPIVITYFNYKKTTSFAYISIILGLIGFFIHPKITANHFYLNISKELFCIFISFLSFPLSYIYNRVTAHYRCSRYDELDTLR